jgi:hypothetical protein
MATLKDHPLWLIGAFVVVTILGNGVYWKWKESKLATVESKLATVVKTTELRTSENEIYHHVIELSKEYAETRDRHEKSPSPATYNKMIALNRQLDLLKADFVTLEKKLAELEKREPRPIPLEFIPPSAPTGLRVVK